MSKFTTADLDTIAHMGISHARIEDQITAFKRSVTFTPLLRAATIGDGLMCLGEAEHGPLIVQFEEAQAQSRVTKFVPASGAATRMFKELHSAREQQMAGEQISDPVVCTFMAELPRFAFFPEIKVILDKKGQRSDDLLAVINALLYDMDYANQPKGLLSFHRYEGGTRSAAQEHLSEVVHYVMDTDGRGKLHFTVSPEHMDAFMEHVEQSLVDFQVSGLAAQVSFSTQKERTNTIAVNTENEPFRDDRGQLLFRPSGHGALIENLNDLKGDILFIKNIDNVVPDRLKPLTTTYKKALAGLLVCIQNKVFAFLQQLDAAPPDDTLCEEILNYAGSHLGLIVPAERLASKGNERGRYLHCLLNRPIRVCGMVKNEGEPGGGPFWVRREDGCQSIQIVETSQIETSRADQDEIAKSATHFNPVDLVCGVRSYSGEAFSLPDFVDPNTCIISEKSYQGRTLKALELPGLWNGSMANWNTCFVEVPLLTFNPVKTINDLLRQQHAGTLIGD